MAGSDNRKFGHDEDDASHPTLTGSSAAAEAMPERDLSNRNEYGLITSAIQNSPFAVISTDAGARSLQSDSYSSDDEQPLLSSRRGSDGLPPGAPVVRNTRYVFKL